MTINKLFDKPFYFILEDDDDQIHFDNMRPSGVFFMMMKLLSQYDNCRITPNKDTALKYANILQEIAKKNSWESTCYWVYEIICNKKDNTFSIELINYEWDYGYPKKEVINYNRQICTIEEREK